MDEVLKSWAIPKGPPMEATEKRLAVLVEDHPLEYIDFEGMIPKGEYGAGKVLIWDYGTYELIEKTAHKMSFSLKGEKLNGDFSLLRLRKAKKGNEWLLIKHK
jgi:bifunctional non-homologous end joining protein LigD